MNADAKDAVLALCPFCGGTAEMDTMRGYRTLWSGQIDHAAAIYCISCSADMTFCYADAPGLPYEDIVANLVDALLAETRARIAQAEQAATERERTRLANIGFHERGMQKEKDRSDD